MQLQQLPFTYRGRPARKNLRQNNVARIFNTIIIIFSVNLFNSLPFTVQLQYWRSTLQQPFGCAKFDVSVGSASVSSTSAITWHCRNEAPISAADFAGNGRISTPDPTDRYFWRFALHKYFHEHTATARDAILWPKMATMRNKIWR